MITKVYCVRKQFHVFCLQKLFIFAIFFTIRSKQTAWSMVNWSYCHSCHNKIILWKIRSLIQIFWTFKSVYEKYILKSELFMKLCFANYLHSAIELERKNQGFLYWSRIHERTVSLRFLGIICETSQTWGFCMDFLNHREGGKVFYQIFLPSPLQKL
jgi:hypothetical protein